jgi:hypothetical protein
MAAEKEKSTPTVTHGAKAKADAPTARLTDEIPAPAISGLAPPSAAVGDPSFSLRVLGSGFTDASVIIFAGHPEPTTYFSDGEVTTGMNMAVWHGADALSVVVRNPDGQESNQVTFDLQPPRAVPLDPAAASQPSPAVDLI